MWCLFVDDANVHGTNDDHCDRRSEVFMDAMEVLDKDLSTKLYADGMMEKPRKDALCGGIYFCAEGTCVDDHAVDSMKFVLTEFVPKNTSDVQHIHGSVQYCHSAFNFNPSNQTEVGELMAQLSDEIKVKPF